MYSVWNRRFVFAEEDVSSDEDVYLCLLKVYLQKGTKDDDASAAASTSTSGGVVGGLGDAVSLLERHFTRVDPVKVSTPFCFVLFCTC